jgi:DMSO/TMAO reductase YedYZ molybdopterin-dependent catalytic subunit
LTGRREEFFRGVLATAGSLAVVFAAGAVIRVIPYPPAALASLIIKAAPGDLATAMIEALGHWAMRLLVIGVHAGMLVFGGMLAPMLARPDRPRGRARRGIGAAVILAGAATVLGLSAPIAFNLLAPIVYAIAGLIYGRGASGEPLSAAFEPSVRPGETPLDVMQRSRRRFVIRAAAAVGGLLVGGAATLRFLTGGSPIEVEISLADEPFRAPPDDPDFPKVTGHSPEITDNDAFYTVDINIIKPSVDHTSWRLEIHGLVDRPYQLTYRRLQSEFAVREIAHTLTCISNEVGGDLISTAVWRGVRLRDVLERAGLKDGVVDIVFRAAEGYSDSIPLAKALEDHTMVVFGMNGEALPREHGFPARIIVPGIYGMKNVKWLTEIEAVDFDYQGYWMVRGWSDIATVKTESRIDTPTEGTVTLPAMLAGVAWAGDRRVMKVEVSDDEGRSWRPAVLKRELSPLTWRLWAADVEPGRGRRRVMVRATDGSGEVQTSRVTAPHPDGASGNHVVVFEVESPQSS